MLDSGPACVGLISNNAPPDDFSSTPKNRMLLSSAAIADTQLRRYKFPDARASAYSTGVPAPL
jgi:hypothetical protein